MGEPTEAALKTLVEKLRTDDSDFNESLIKLGKAARAQAVSTFYKGKFTKVATLDFDRDSKSMSVLVRPTETRPKKLPGQHLIVVNCW